MSETLSTIRFAQNAKTLKNNPKINSVIAELKVSFLKNVFETFEEVFSMGFGSIKGKMLIIIDTINSIKNPQKNYPK